MTTEIKKIEIPTTLDEAKSYLRDEYDKLKDIKNTLERKYNSGLTYDTPNEAWWGAQYIPKINQIGDEISYIKELCSKTESEIIADVKNYINSQIEEHNT
ncbi:MAG: hypothetical protein GQ477_02040 [Nanohaloarchaea archaeon]|nr:hypothetical protein [Candidatus Nanohaloarchaea archaeon]